MDGTAFNFALQNYYFILDYAKKMKKIEKKLIQAEQKWTVPYLAMKLLRKNSMTI